MLQLEAACEINRRVGLLIRYQNAHVFGFILIMVFTSNNEHSSLAGQIRAAEYDDGTHALFIHERFYFTVVRTYNIMCTIINRHCVRLRGNMYFDGKRKYGDKTSAYLIA